MIRYNIARTLRKSIYHNIYIHTRCKYRGRRRLFQYVLYEQVVVAFFSQFSLNCYKPNNGIFAKTPNNIYFLPTEIKTLLNDIQFNWNTCVHLNQWNLSLRYMLKKKFKHRYTITQHFQATHRIDADTDYRYKICVTALHYSCTLAQFYRKGRVKTQKQSLKQL